MRVLRLLVELEVGRPDDDHGVRADLGRVRGQRDRVRGRLRTAVHGDLESPVGCLQEQVGHLATLLRSQEDPLARRPEGEEPVEPRGDVEVGEGLERGLVDLGAVLPQRRHRCGERTAERSHQRLDLPSGTRSSVPAMRRARVSGRFASSIHSTYSR